MEQHKEQHNPIHKDSISLTKSSYEKLFITMGIILVIITLFNIYQGRSFGIAVSQTISEVEEASRPAEIQLTTISSSNCQDCFDISPIVESIKAANVNITKEESLDLDSEEAKELIDNHNIEKIPTVLVIGEIDKLDIVGLEEQNNALVFTQQFPSYIDIASNKIVGRVSSIIIKDSSCTKCTDLTSVLDGIGRFGVNLFSKKTVEKESVEGKMLIDKYSLKILPALIISKDLKDYGSTITDGWSQLGSVESDGSYVTRTITPPYLNLTTNKIEGLVDVTFLTDNSCDKCYDVEQLHKPILQRMGIVISKENTIDISDSEGKDLIAKYKVKKVPTIILKGDMEKYPALVTAWKNVGTTESDGAYIFRNMNAIQQIHKDLTTDKVVEPSAAG